VLIWQLEHIIERTREKYVFDVLGPSARTLRMSTRFSTLRLLHCVSQIMDFVSTSCRQGCIAVRPSYYLVPIYHASSH